MKAAAYKGSDYLKTQKDVVAYLNAALEDGELFASIAQDGRSESAVLVVVAVFALPFVLDTVFLPVTVPHDLMLVK